MPLPRLGMLMAVLLSWALIPCLSPSLSLAQTTTVSPRLNDLYQLAWQRHPAFAAKSARQSQYAASSELAKSVIAGAPSASIGYRTDSVSAPSTRSGLREWEVGVSTPLALGERRRFSADTAQLQAQLYGSDLHKAQWLLAGELRESYWTWQLAHLEHLLLDDELRRAQVLVADSKRRSQAGETPRVDTLQAEAALHLLRVHLAEALQKEAQALTALQRLTGHAPLAHLSESALGTYQTETLRTDTVQADGVSSHPLIASLERQRALAQSKLAGLLAVKGEPPSIGAGLSREASNASAAQTTARITVTFSLGSESRYTPKIAEANADAIESEITLQRATEQLAQDRLLAKAALDNAAQKMQAAKARAAASTEAALLFAKAFSLGELDMPTRLRAEADRAAAVLAVNRAVVEHAAAISKLNQLLGYLP